MASDPRREKPTVEAAVRAWAESARGDRGAAIPIEEIVAYLEGRLSVEQEEGFRERLLLDRQAAKLVADLLTFPDLEALPEILAWAPEDERGQRATLERRLAREGLGPRTVPRTEPSRWPTLLAAIFCVAAVGLGLWVHSLRQRIEVLSGPTGNVSVHTLRSEAQREGDSPWVEEIAVSADAPAVVVILRAPGREDLFEARVLSSEGVELWRHRALRPDGWGNLILLWPRSRLEQTEYRLELHPGHDSVNPIAVYRIRSRIQGGRGS